MSLKVCILKKKSSLLNGLEKRLKGAEGKNLDITITNDPDTIPDNTDMLIRWGNTLKTGRKFRFVVNNADNISNAANKLDALKIFNGSKVNTPNFATSVADAKKKLKYPILARQAVHSKGTDIKLIIQSKDFDVYDFQGIKFDYFLSYIPTDREFRVHVFNNEVIKINRKVFNNADKTYVPYNRSEENGYFFSTDVSAESKTALDTISKLAKEAVQSLGLHFGAVDLVRGEDGAYYVLEVNTAPGIDKDELAYVQAISKYVLSKESNKEKTEKPAPRSRSANIIGI